MILKSTATFASQLIGTIEESEEWEHDLCNDQTLANRRKALFDIVERIRTSTDGDWQEDFELALELYAGARDILAMLHGLRAAQALQTMVERPAETLAFIDRRRTA